MLPSDLLVGNSADLPNDAFNDLGDDTTNIAHAGNTVFAEMMWKKWIKFVKKVRKKNTVRFLMDRGMQEDLLLGPRDGPRLIITDLSVTSLTQSRRSKSWTWVQTPTAASQPSG